MRDVRHHLSVRAMAVTAIAALALAACGDDDGGDDAAPVTQPAAPATAEVVPQCDVRTGEEPDRAPSLDALRDRSDAVVLGTVAERTDETVTFEELDLDIGYAIYRIEPDEVLAGEIDGPLTVSVEVSHHDCQLVVGTRPTPTEGDRGIWFVSRLDTPSTLSDYVLTTSQGVMLEPGGNDESGTEPDDDLPTVDWLTYDRTGPAGITEELAELASIEELAERLASG